MTDGAHGWLPDRHLGVAATLAHTDELVAQVADLLFDYQSQPEGIVQLKEIRAGTCSRTVVVRLAPIPSKIPLLVADALVALRAALEHALFTEVEFLDGAPLDEKAARLVEIPASETYEKFEEWKKKRVRNGPRSLQPGSELVRRVDGLQPLHRHSDPQMHPLARLVLHTNHAKHRTPAITAVRLAAMYRDDQLPQSPRDLPPRPEAPLRVGEVIAETPLGERVPITLFPTIGINRPGTDRWPVLMKELAEISEWVRTQAVPRLITGMDPPKPALPTRYTITIGHNDERKAISEGSTTSAAEQHQQRLDAAVIRQDLVGIIGMMDGAPSNGEITAWLAQLPDDEVVTRMSGLLPAPTYDPDVVLRNFKALEVLRDDAVAFAREGQSI